MRIAIIGSRGICPENLGDYVTECDEVVSGGAVGTDTYAGEYAKERGIKLTVFLPDYSRYGRAAPIVRNKKIVDYADKIIAFWDGCSRGTRSVINYAKKANKPCTVIITNTNEKKGP